MSILTWRPFQYSAVATHIFIDTKIGRSQMRRNACKKAKPLNRFEFKWKIKRVAFLRRPLGVTPNRTRSGATRKINVDYHISNIRFSNLDCLMQWASTIIRGRVRRVFSKSIHLHCHCCGRWVLCCLIMLCVHCTRLSNDKKRVEFSQIDTQRSK